MERHRLCDAVSPELFRALEGELDCFIIFGFKPNGDKICAVSSYSSLQHYAIKALIHESEMFNNPVAVEIKNDH